MRKYLIISVFCIFSMYAMAQTAGFSWSYSTGTPCIPVSVSFSNTSTNPSGITGVNWNFGDGTPAYTDPTTDPVHPYTQPGNYTVTLTVNYGSTTKTYSETIRIVEPMKATFTKTNDSICPGEIVNFNVVPTPPATAGDIVGYLWNFGDGGSSSSATPSYRYMNANNQNILYDVTLTITDRNGCNYTIKQDSFVFVHHKPKADFYIDGDSVFCYNATQTTATVNFKDSTTVTSNNTYKWIFGNWSNPLATSTQANPTQTFPVGNYDITLISTSPEGCSDTITKSNGIRMVNFEISKTISDTILCDIPAEVTFRGTNGGGTNYHWRFGNGYEAFTTASPYTTTYRQEGTYMVTVDATHISGCTTSDTSYVHVYAKKPAVANIIDTNICDPARAVVFQNATPYSTTDDFGFGKTKWIFGDGDTSLNNNTSHTYPGFGDYEVMFIHTTPYGCDLDTAYYNIHVFALRTRATVVDPDPMQGPPDGCIPHKVILANIPDSLKTSSPITDFIWRWDYFGNPNDTTNSGSTGQVQHTYTDTGVYQVYVTLINQEGCTFDVFITQIRAGVVPVCDFDYDFKQGCKSEVGLSVRAYDSLDSQGKLVGSAKANGWTWQDDMGNPLADGDTTSVSPPNVGYNPVTLVPDHNGCQGPAIRKDSVAYVCPPIAGFDNPKNNMDGTPPLYCEYPLINFAKDHGKVQGTKYIWWFGDGSHGFGDTTKMSRSDTLTGNDPDPVFQYPYGTKDSSSHHEPDYLYTLNGVISMHLWAMNDDSLDPSSPTYNRCGYCEDETDQIMLVSDAQMNFSTNLGRENIYICEGDSILFWDSTKCVVPIIGWGFGFTNAADNTPGNLVNPYNQYLSLDPYYRAAFSGMSPIGGWWVTFPKPNAYDVLLQDTCALGCIRNDSLRIFIYPRSTPKFSTSARDTSFFYFGRDTLCASNPDTLYVRDESFSPVPFDTVKIIGWKWKLNRDSSTLQNPILLDTFYGLHDLSLTITNEYGCDSTITAEEYVLVNLVQAGFNTSSKTYCNKQAIAFSNTSDVYPREFNGATRMICDWDFGDGSTYQQIITRNSTPALKTVSHTYDLPNVSNKVVVTLTVTTEDGTCSDIYIDTLTINRPIADFDDDGHIFPCIGTGQTITFSSTSQGNIDYYEWNFGDTLSGTANIAVGSNMDTVVHRYSTAGTYDITLIVTDDFSCTDTIFRPSYIFIDGPSGTFTYSPLSGCTNLRTEFTPSVTNVDTVIISPDGGNQMTFSGIAINNTQRYTYRTPGMYIPYFYLIKWTNDGSGNMERCVVQWSGEDTIWAILMEPDFDTVALYCPGTPVTFTNKTDIQPNTLGLDSANWVFFNGGDTVNMIDGVTQYDSAGTYKVTMIGYSKLCNKTKSYYIEVMDVPDLRFIPDTAKACDGLEVEFKMDSTTYTDLQYSRMVDWQWTFNDGEQLSGHPVNREFTQTGNYTFNVDVTFTPENCVKTYIDTVIVFAYNSPIANFTPNPTEATAGETFKFVDASTQGDGALKYWSWDFGDNNKQDSSTTPNAEHIYENTSGYITVTLVVIDEYGCKSSVQKQVLVTESMQFPNILTPDGDCGGSPCLFRPIEDKGFFKELKMEIYDKWGALVWKNSCKDPDCPNNDFWWDGRNRQGNTVSDGVYYWVIYGLPLSETNTIIMNGSVTVMR